jgi:hypothetical protein
MNIEYHLTQRDLLAARDHVQECMRERGERLGFWSALALGMLGGLLWLMWAHPGAGWIPVVFLLVFSSLAAWAVYSLRLGHSVRWLSRAEGAYALELAPAGVTLRAPDGRTSFHSWPEIAALETASDFVIFYMRAGAAFAVPRTGLEGDAAMALTAEARALWAAAPGHAGQGLSAEPVAPESPSFQAWVNLREAGHLALFLPFDPHAIRAAPTPGALGALAIHLAALAFMLGAISYLQALPIPLFNPAGVLPFAAPIVLAVIWAAAVSARVGQRSGLLRLLVIAVAALLFVSMAAFFSYQAWVRQLSGSPVLSLAWHAAIALWVLAIFARAVRALYGRSRLQALSTAAAYLLMALAVPALAPQGPLYLDAASVQPYYAPASDEEDGAVPQPNAPGRKDDNFLDDDEGDGAQNPGDTLDVEQVYYQQPQLVQKALAGVRPHQAGETGLYFVGFAGDGSEHEFFNEVRYARNLLDRRFNTAGRSVMLVNSYDTVDDLPLANAHNLEAVLQGLAQRMDKEHDVLFLFLSSHGAEDHWLEVSLDPMQMNDLKAETLKEMLDNSGIRNRVIVVSACYSGGFLDVLKDDNTLVLTASRRDHVAYGCGDVTEYTFFGEAYFVKALEHSNSFINAFAEARGRIADREHSEGMDPSGPQISVGRNIADVLHALKVVPAAAAPLKVHAPGAQPLPAAQPSPAGCTHDCPGDSQD